MRVLIVPDSFGGTLSAAQVAAAMAEGWRAVAPDAELDLAPMSDGGPGFVEVVPGELRTATVTGPLGAATQARWRLDGDTAYLETAEACGLHLVDALGPETAWRASTRGVGELAAAALTAGARTLVLGLGGSASTDGGCGFLDAFRQAFPSDLPDVDLVAATDVDSPLLGSTGAARMFGPQKGADPATVDRLEQRLAGLGADRPGADQPGAGAAGGLGFALLTLGARRVSGAALVGDLLELPARVAAADLVVTGEGSYDASSLRGKVTGYVAGLAAAAGVPCVVIAGRVAVGRREAGAHGVAETWDLTEHSGAAARESPAASLEALCRRVARQWSGP